MACDGICYKLFYTGDSLYLKCSLLLLDFNRNSTSTFLNKSVQLEVISKYCKTDKQEDQVASLHYRSALFAYFSSDNSVLLLRKMQFGSICSHILSAPEEQLLTEGLRLQLCCIVVCRQLTLLILLLKGQKATKLL